MCYKEPRTNTAFWREKVRRNRARREEVRAGLEARRAGTQAGTEVLAEGEEMPAQSNPTVTRGGAQ